MLGFSPISTTPIAALPQAGVFYVEPVVAVGEVGQITLISGSTVVVGGVVGVGQVGTPIISAGATINATGVFAEVAVADTTAFSPYTHEAATFELLGQVGLVSVFVSNTLAVNGVSAQGRIGGTTTWAQVRADITVVWTDINL